MPRITKSLEESVASVQLTSFTADAEQMYPLDFSSGDFTVHLPTASGVPGQDIILSVVSSGAGIITVLPSGSETVNHVNELQLLTYDTVVLTSNGVDDWGAYGSPYFMSPAHQRVSYAHMYVSSGLSTAITAGVYAKLNSTTSMALSNYFDMPTSNRLRYVGQPAKVFAIDCSASFSASVPNSLVHIVLAKNGTLVEGSNVDRFVSATGDHGNSSSMCIVPLASGDYIELHGTANKSLNLTVDHAIFTAKEV